jgi:thiazole synthase
MAIGQAKDELIIGGKRFTSRLLLGTGKFRSNKEMAATLQAAGVQIVTTALRRADTDFPKENILNYIPKEMVFMPNTSGARNAEEAVRIAHLSRALGCGDWIKIEVISDNRYLMPDNMATIAATQILVKEGFTVLPYINPDLGTAVRLTEAGAAAVMPLAAPIGSNRGLRTKELLQILIDEIDIPIVVDAGVGRPSEAAEAMELGADAVLVNTAVATAGNTAQMAQAFQLAVQAGRLAYLSRPGRVLSGEASASSPLTGFLRNKESEAV